MCTHKSKCVINQLHSLLFMKAKLWKVLSSSTESKTYTIIILTIFIYSFSLRTRSGKDWIFNHIRMIKFTFDGFHITTFHGESKIKSLHIKLPWIQKPKTTTPPLIFIPTQNPTLNWSKCGRKFFVAFFSPNQCYMYTMPKANMISTSKNLFEITQHIRMQQPLHM
jgi:hypothetical protein